MSYVDRRGWSTFITGRQARELHAASTFAGVIACPLLYRVHINWTRTALEGDFDGAALASYRARLARWLRHPDQSGHAFHAIYVRERPSAAAARPNDHLHVHIPADLVDRFYAVATDLLPRTAFPLGERAVVVDAIGWTTPARDGALAYLLKGTAPKAARLITEGGLLKLDHKPQGRVYGKRCGVSETLGRAARRRYGVPLIEEKIASAFVA